VVLEGLINRFLHGANGGLLWRHPVSHVFRGRGLDEVQVFS
jgi:hypothetical protein